MKRSKKYAGVYLNEISGGDITFYIQYIDEDKKNTKIKIGRKSEGITENYCYHKRNELITQLRLGENPFSNKNVPSFNEVAQKYFINLSNNGRSEYSTKNELQRYTNHIAPLMGSKSINLISVELLNKLKKEKNKTHAEKTVNNILELISCILNFGTRVLDLKLTNNIKNGKVKKNRIDNQRQRFLNKQEIQLLLKNTKINYKVDLATRFALSTGARLGTILSIQKKDIDQVNNTITLKDHKNNSTYTSYLAPVYFNNYDFLNKLKANDYVISNDGNPINKSTIQHPFKKIADKLFNIGLDSKDRANRVVFHSLRHSYCSLLAISGTPIFTIQKLVNHKDIKSTIRYSKLDTNMFKSVQDAFNF